MNNLDAAFAQFAENLSETIARLPEPMQSMMLRTLEFRSTLLSETDRGCALMAASYMDTRLCELLEKHFVDDADVRGQVLGIAKLLGTFSSRIDLAYLLGHLSREEHRDLHLIRKVRNDFGHNPSPITFEHAPIASRCRELSFTMHEKSCRPRGHFTNSVFGIIGAIEGAICKTPHMQAKQAAVPNTETKTAFWESEPLFGVLKNMISEAAREDN